MEKQWQIYLENGMRAWSMLLEGILIIRRKEGKALILLNPFSFGKPTHHLNTKQNITLHNLPLHLMKSHLDSRKSCHQQIQD
ncbi:uncharacterized protein DS421_8g250910 [Arachis hypogaea]|nr:uncharacterized protein DS421_8g250910 [Arachis hypogaea]